MAAVSYDSPAVTADFTKRRGITFPLLSDPGSKTIKAYGLLNTTLKPTDQNYGIPFPGTFILDPDGRVTARFFENEYRERNTVATILLNLGERGGRDATRITTDHLQVTSYVSDEVVAPGSIFSLFAEIKPGERIHVYAPGAHDYRVVALKLEPSPVLKPRPVKYPPSTIYYFAPLKERVPVYETPFRLVQEVFVDPSPASADAVRDLQALTIKGVLEYQACDDKICFNPVSLPLTWTVRVRQLDRERANVPPRSD